MGRLIAADYRMPNCRDTLLNTADASPDTATSRQSYALSGPVTRPSAAIPLRGDLAHVALAGRYFVPHYAVPQPRAVLPGGAPLMASTSADAAEICTLMEGDSFEVLDLVAGYAWGCLSLEGPSGYIHLDRLEPVA